MAELEPTEKSSATVETRMENGTPVVSVCGDLDLSTVEDIRAAVEAALGDESERVVFDMSELKFMDSSGIALLVRIARRVQTVELRNLSPIVRRLIELTGLEETLRIAR